MKTRLISMTLGIFFAAVTVAEGTNISKKELSSASRHEYAVEQNFTPMISGSPSAESLMLEEWIDSRNNWEQEEQGMAANGFLSGSAMLEEWVTARDSWEQGQQKLTGENSLGKTSLLEDWIASRKNWEEK